jgi:hypothetical protein
MAFPKTEKVKSGISIVDSGTQRRLVMEGALITPWVSELRTAWTGTTQYARFETLQLWKKG